MMSSVEPDLLITPSTGKTFTPEGDVYDWIAEQQSVLNMCCILEEQVFINYADKQSLAKAKGVDWIYEAETPLHEHMIKGTFSLHRGDVPLACVGAELLMNPEKVEQAKADWKAELNGEVYPNPLPADAKPEIW